ncbi:MAG: 50S ribosomal protein L9 [Actinomycetales bacterium]|nr:50S ribosomal protein L9 [Actinomycetales bacterium]
MSKLILTSEVTGLGSAGDIVEVKNGYARNYLVPQGFAVPWTRGAEKQIDRLQAARAAREAASLEDAQALKAKLEEKPVTLAVTAGREGRLFGSVKSADVAEAVKAAGLGEIDRHSIELTAPIKATGEHEASVRLRSDVVAQLTIQVVAAK